MEQALTRVSNTPIKPPGPNSTRSVLTKWQFNGSAQTYVQVYAYKYTHAYTQTRVTDPFSNGSQKPEQEFLWSFMGIDPQ